MLKLLLSKIVLYILYSFNATNALKIVNHHQSINLAHEMHLKALRTAVTVVRAVRLHITRFILSCEADHTIKRGFMLIFKLQAERASLILLQLIHLRFYFFDHLLPLIFVSAIFPKFFLLKQYEVVPQFVDFFAALFYYSRLIRDRFHTLNEVSLMSCENFIVVYTTKLHCNFTLFCS